MSTEASAGCPVRFFVFRIDGTEYALPVSAVREVLLPTSLEPAQPQRPGLTHYRVKARGSDTAVIYFGRSKRLSPRNRVLLLNDVNAGLLVDSVSRVEEVAAERQANGKVKLGAKWRNVFDAVRLVHWALDHSATANAFPAPRRAGS